MLNKDDGIFLPSIDGVISGKTSQVAGMNEIMNNLIGNDNYLDKRKMSTENTIEDLKSSKKYKLGDVVEVLGFHAKGDGSHHKRIAKDKDDGSGELGQGGIWWCIVHNGEVNVSWFGFKDMDNIDNILSYVYDKEIKLKLAEGNHVFTSLKITSNTNIEGMKTETSFLLYKGTDINAIIREDNDKIVLGARFANLYLTTAKDGSGASLAQDLNKDKIGLNLYGCNYTVIENIGIGGFGSGAIKFGRCEGGAEGQGFVNTNKDGNYNTLKNVRSGYCGKYGTAVVHFDYKANSNNIYALYIKGGVNKAILFTYAGNNNIFGGTIESVEDCVTFEDLSRMNNCYGLRMEGFGRGYVSEGDTENIPNSVINPFFSTGTKEFDLQKELMIFSSYKSSLNTNKYPSANLSTRVPTISTVLNYITSSEDDTVNIIGRTYGSGFPTLRFIDTKTNAILGDILSTIKYKTSDTSNVRDTLIESVEYIDTVGNVAKKDKFYNTADGITITHTDYRGKTFMPLKSNLANKPIDGVYWNDASKTFVMYIKGVAQVSLTQLDTPYYAYKMQQEGIYDDYVAYRDELHEYESSQASDDTMLLPILQEPVIPESIKEFAEKYKLI